MNLYDWVSRCKRQKLPKTDTPNADDIAGVDKDAIDGQDDQSFELTTKKDGPTDEQEVGETSKATSRPKSTTHSFLSPHPLYKTHGMNCAPEGKGLIPNFTGATLPRQDQGDREYYCLTMLTLFKPW